MGKHAEEIDMSFREMKIMFIVIHSFVLLSVTSKNIWFCKQMH